MYLNELIGNSSILSWVFAAILGLCLMIQLSYYLFIYSKFPAFRQKKNRRGKEGVSVIICARNEAENLDKHLPHFLSQDYHDYEVIVVNDCSSDRTEEILMNMKARYPHLRYTSIPIDEKFTHGKKLAVTVGIKAARHEHMLFSDADCYPLSDQWIKVMTGQFRKKTELVLGIGKYEHRKGLLNALIRYETLFTAMQYISYALRGKAYMGVGRNMAYKKELFFRHKGFASHLKVLSGDDDLFVNEAATKQNVRVALHPDSFTISKPAMSFREWSRQKRRHITSGKHYKLSSRLSLALEYISRMLFYSSIVVLLFDTHWRWIALGSYAVLSSLKLIYTKLAMQRLKEKDLLLPSLLFDPLMPCILGVLGLLNLLSPRQPKWN